MILPKFCAAALFAARFSSCLAEPCHPGTVRECLSRFEEIVAKCGEDIECQCDALWTSGAHCFNSCPQEAQFEFVSNFRNGECVDYSWKRPLPASDQPSDGLSESLTATANQSKYSVVPSPSFVSSSHDKSFASLFMTKTESSPQVYAMGYDGSDQPAPLAGLYGPRVKKILGLIDDTGLERRGIQTPEIPATNISVPSTATNSSLNATLSLKNPAGIKLVSASSSASSSSSSSSSTSTSVSVASTTTLSPEEQSKKKQLQRMKENLRSIRSSRAQESLLSEAAAAAAATAESTTTLGFSATESRIVSGPTMAAKKLDKVQYETHESSAVDHISRYLLWLSALLILLYIGAPMWAAVGLVGFIAGAYLVN